jgi:hypothetical protein
MSPVLMNCNGKRSNQHQGSFTFMLPCIIIDFW